MRVSAWSIAPDVGQSPLGKPNLKKKKKEIRWTSAIQRYLTFRMATVIPLYECVCLCVCVCLHSLCSPLLSMYLTWPDIRGRPKSNKAQRADRKRVHGVGANWYLIAEVGFSISESDCRHTVHEMNCAWVAQRAEVFFLLFSTSDLSHQTSISTVSLTALSKGNRFGPEQDSYLLIFSVIQKDLPPKVNLSLLNKQLEDQLWRGNHFFFDGLRDGMGNNFHIGDGGFLRFRTLNQFCIIFSYRIYDVGFFWWLEASNWHSSFYFMFVFLHIWLAALK